MRLIDSSVHPQVPKAEDLKQYVAAPWNQKFWPGTERYHFPHPVSEYLGWARPAAGLPGSDPALMAKHLFEDRSFDYAVLLPLTRGLVPDVDLGTAICAGTNRWLSETWLGAANEHGRFKGSIRVNPMDPQGAVREIEQWAGHPHMVQVAVPMEAHSPYGQRQFFPIWEAAARHNLPVAVHPDFAPGVEFSPSPVGYPRWYIEFASFYSGTFYYHLSNLIAEGVFDRLPNLVFVFPDGGLDLLMPSMWRLNEHWRALRFEHPWTKKQPTEYLRDHVRFCTHRMEGPDSAEQIPGWLEIADAEHLLMYASNYPHWTFAEPAQVVPATLPEAARRMILGENAGRLYRIAGRAPAGAGA
jgi:predicted TIM-barrel fold metal-dependent hydrolase